MLATFAGHLGMVKYLRSRRASWEARGLGGCTALHWAAGGGHHHAIEWMIDEGCNVGILSTHFAEKPALSQMGRG